jgi:phosphate starvation-inducible PhoH-like protein
MNEKVDPYMAPIWEALADIVGRRRPAAPAREGRHRGGAHRLHAGRTLSHAFVIVDEAQNASRLQMKMVLTRLGEGARMVVTGDPTQVDLLNPRDSGLAHALGILDGDGGRGRAPLRGRGRGASPARGADRQGL